MGRATRAGTLIKIFDAANPPYGSKLIQPLLKNQWCGRSKDVISCEASWIAASGRGFKLFRSSVGAERYDQDRRAGTAFRRAGRDRRKHQAWRTARCRGVGPEF